MKMNPDVKREWLKRLRSKKAKQVRGTLKQVDGDGAVVGHCCLGVLCEIHKETHPNFRWRGDEEPSYGSTRTEQGTLTKAVRTWAGLDIDACTDLIFHNDTDKLTFPEIAKVISKEY